MEPLLRQACAQLHRGVRDGVRAEQLLDRHPALAEHADLAVELIYTEFVAREQLGQQPRTEEYLERFPRWQVELSAQFQVHQSLRNGDLAVPGPLAGYDLLEVVGQGAVSTVYRARQRELDRMVAIKLLHADLADRDQRTRRYQQEAALAARLSHPNVLQIHEAGEHQGRGYLVLEYAAGGTLAERLHGEPQPPRAAAELAETLARAVEHIHQQGVIHRDLKPANVLLPSAIGHRPLAMPKIGDFSLAMRSDQPMPEGVAGTPSYMAPEQARGEAAAPAVDVYALGAILYELLTGRPPFRADTPLRTLEQVQAAEPAPPRALQPGVPADLETICLKCLAKEPGRRYGTALALADDLRRYLNGEPIQARPTGRFERAWKWARRRPAAAGLLAVSLLAILTITLGSLWTNVRLQEAADTEASLKAAALEQLAATRQSLYTIQLAQVEEIHRTDPGRALEMLEDEAACPPDLRDFAWGMFHTLCRQDLRTLRGPGPITALSISADRIVAAAGQNLLVWNTNGQELESKDAVLPAAAILPGGLAGPVHALARSPRGNQLVLAGNEGCLRIVDSTTGALILEKKLPGVLPYTALAWSPDGQHIAATGTRDGPIHLCRADTLEVAATAKGHLKTARAVVFSPNGNLLASAGDDRDVKLWQLPGLTPAGQFKGHTAIVRHLAFAPDGLTLASGSDDGTVRLWPLRPAPSLSTSADPPRKIVCLAFTPDGVHLLAGQDDGRIVRHDARSAGIESVYLAHDDAVLCLAIAADGGLIASGGDNGEVRLWDARLQLLARLPGHQRRVRAVAISPDARMAASAGEDGKVRLWDVKDRKQAALLDAGRGSVRSVGFSPDGRTLATGNDDGSVSLWDLASREERQRIPASDKLLLISQFSPDGRTLATGGLDYRVGLWAMPSGERKRLLTGHTEYVFSAAFTPDGRTLATGSGNRFSDVSGEVKLWDAATGHARATLAGQTGPVAFSPDGRTLATVDGYTAIKLWRSAASQ